MKLRSQKDVRERAGRACEERRALDGLAAGNSGSAELILSVIDHVCLLFLHFTIAITCILLQAVADVKFSSQCRCDTHLSNSYHEMVLALYHAFQEAISPERLSKQNRAACSLVA